MDRDTDSFLNIFSFRDTQVVSVFIGCSVLISKNHSCSNRYHRADGD